MKGLKWFAAVLVILVAGIAGFLSYLGMFSPLIVSEQKMGPFVYAYKEFTGPYQKTMPVFSDVNKILKAAEIKSERGLGVYFDNPQQVAADKLRSNCGCILEESDSTKISALQGKLKLGNFAQADCVVAEFPAKNPVSYMIGPMKVYPVLAKYMTAKNYKFSKSYELYDIPNKKIYYFFVINK